jgi:TolB-like protein/Flp pilus assembly protein TadD
LFCSYSQLWSITGSFPILVLLLTADLIEETGPREPYFPLPDQAVLNYRASFGVPVVGEKASPTRGIVRFGLFEFDSRLGELRKQGLRIRLQKQPSQLLQILLEHPGETVTREELQQRIWPADTFVDFDQGVSNAIKRLREALCDSAESPRFIETIPRRGYRFIAGLGTPAGKIESLAVLPLENISGDPKEEYFADGMTEALITNLAKISALHVVSRTTAMHYKGVHRPLREIAGELQADAIVEGTVMRSGQRIRISAQLISAHDDVHLWAESYDRDLTDVLALQAEVARAIAREIQIKVTTQEQAQLARTRPVKPEAYEAYLKGRFYWNKRSGESMKQGLECFQRAIDADPTYAAAYAGLADSAAVLGWWGFAPPEDGFLKAKATARKALSLDATLAEPHACLGFSLIHYDYDFAAAEAEFRRAFELNPRLATAAQWYGIVRYLMNPAADSMAELWRAKQLDPLSQVIRWTVAHFLFFERKYDEAIEESREALQLDNFGPARQVIGVAYAKQGMYEAAIAELTQLVSAGRNPNFLGSLGYALAAAGKKDRALEVAKEMEGLFPMYSSAYWTAMILAEMNDKDEACRRLEAGYRERSAHMIYMNVDPRFDKVRSDPRFQDLLRRMKLPQVQ